MNEENTDVLEYEKMYQKKNGSKKLIWGLIIVLGIYLFFFTSRITLSPAISTAPETTNIGEEYQYGQQRAYRLISAVYSAEDKTMELVIDFKNMNYDNVNDYYYAVEILNGNSNRLEIKEVYHEDLFTVIRISDVNRRYKELTLYFAPKTVAMAKVTDDMTGTITVNKRNAAAGKIDPDKAKGDYLEERFNIIIGDYNGQIKALQKECEEIQTELEAIKKEGESLQKNKAYMTDAEIAEKAENIRLNEGAKGNLLQQLEQNQQKIEELKQEVQSAKEKKNQI